MNNITYMIFLSVVAALGGFLFGYDTAVISGTIKSVSAQFGMNDVQTGWYVGCALLGSIFGVTVAGRISDKFGRKPVLFVAAVLFTLSAAGCMLSANESQLIVYRIIGGIGIGVASIISPLYISEIAVARYRGTMVSLYQLAITVGFLAAYLINYAVLRHALTATATAGSLRDVIFVAESWRAMLGMETIPALLFFAMLLFIPESPRWLMVQEREEHAGRILARMYGQGNAARQMEAIRSLMSQEVKSDWKLLVQRGFRTAVLTGVCLALLGQFMGVNAVLYYGPSIFEQTGISEGDSLLYQVVVGAVNVGATLLGMWLIDRIGRKKLVYWGVSGMIVSLFLIGWYFIINRSATLVPPVSLLILILAYIFSCAVSICMVIWVLLSEMYPARIRGAAMSIAGLSLWTGTCLIGQLTPWLMTNLSPSGVFWLFGVMCVPYVLIVWKLVPETTGKSLEEIERAWKR
ncbi:MAG: sugar porter family MFS transporter [Bacteroidales bacterium]|nr:sugar porter family MFS transporter [Bacteroidales bacterium]